MVKNSKCFVFLYLSLIILLPSSLITTVNAETNKRNFPYQLSRKDIFAVSLSYAFNIAANKYIDQRAYTLTIDDISGLNRNSVNGLDRAATYNWNPKLSEFSDFFYKSMPYIAPSIAIPAVLRKEWYEAFTILTMYSEVYFLTQGLTQFVKGAAIRVRPYAYNTSMSIEDRYEIQASSNSNGTKSFFSGHTSTVFSSAFFLSKVYQDIYGKGIKSRLIWGTTLTAATLTAYSRVKSGNHYLTDVLVGATVGSAIGYFIPQMHKIKDRKFSVALGPNAVQLSYSF